jgi:Mn2+/Fe2+ NRAMP family transporter
MTALILVQQGGILAGVAQSLAGGLPVTAAGREWNRLHDEAAGMIVSEAAVRRRGDAAEADAIHARLDAVTVAMKSLPAPPDETIWAVVVGVVTAVLLAIGRYRLIEWVSILLVGTFTLVTLLALVMLQFDPAWAISSGEIASGLMPSIPPAVGGRSPLVTALATIGIIGVGASELMIYPYWAARARGWLRVMQLDAWGSMIVYTTVTICFYLLGAATLGRLGLRPAGGEMVRTLGAMYAPVFGEWARGVFLIGAFAVLYSTLFVAAAGNARMVVDGLILAGRLPADDATRAVWSKRLSVAWPLVALMLALIIREPVGMVLASGIAQAIMLAALGVAVLFFRHRDFDARLAPSRAWDLLLWVCSAGFILLGLWTLGQKVAALL